MRVKVDEYLHKKMIEQALQETDGNQRKAALLLKLPKSTLNDHIFKLGIDVRSFKIVKTKKPASFGTGDGIIQVPGDRPVHFYGAFGTSALKKIGVLNPGEGK